MPRLIWSSEGAALAVTIGPSSFGMPSRCDSRAIRTTLTTDFIRGYYEVLVLQVTVATIFDFCFGPTFFLVRSLGASRGDDLYSLTLRGE